MAYRKPFTPLQRHEALRAVKSYRKHHRLLRRRYAPANAQQRDLLDDYADTLAKLEIELRKPDRSMNVMLLNRLDASARWLAMDYWRLRNDKR